MAGLVVDRQVIIQPKRVELELQIKVLMVELVQLGMHLLEVVVRALLAKMLLALPPQAMVELDFHPQ
jgi:hypothetical protein